ncbi:MAG: DMT family transporter [Rhizonema sp. NSF051]|nr:DMT family transporter [Rhizonema sp. NSF051]
MTAPNTDNISNTENTLNTDRTQLYYVQGIVLMIITAFIWASTFVAIKEIVSSVSPTIQVAIRFTLGAMAFAIFARDLNIRLVRDGIIIGLFMFCSVTTETIGLQTLQANQATFIYGLTVSFVTLFELVFRRRISVISLLAAVIAVTGIVIMGWDNGPPPIGEYWMFLCAFFSAGFMIALEIIGQDHPPLPFTMIQLSTIAVLSWLWAAPELIGNLEIINQTLRDFTNLSFLLYLGIIGTAVVIWIQTMALRRITAFDAVVIQALEPIFGAILAFLFLGETFGTNGFIGAGMVLVAMFMALSQKKAQQSSEAGLQPGEDHSPDSSGELNSRAIEGQSIELSPK